MRIRSIFVIALLSGLVSSSLASAETVTWRMFAKQPNAVKIAACNDGQVYYTDTDRWLWVLRSGNADRPWQRLSRLSMKVESISCAAQRLYVLGVDKVLYRNDGDDVQLRWHKLGQLPWARHMTAGTLGRGAALYALGTDGGLMVSETGDGRTWSKLGQTPARAERISAASLRDVFGLDADGRLYVNHGGGREPYWRMLDAPLGAIEIASANARRLYALAGGSVWEGTVARDVRYVRMGPEFNLLVTAVLRQMQIRMWEGCETQLTPDERRERLAGEERLPRPGRVCNIHLQVLPSAFLQQYGLETVHVTVPRISEGNISGFSSSLLAASLSQDRLALSATFTNTRFTANSPVGPLGFDIVNIRLSGELVPTKDRWGDVAFSLANFRFNGEVRGTDVPSTVATWFRDFRGDIEERLGPQLADLVASADVQAAIRQVLLETANFFTRETWRGIDYGGISIQGGVLQLGLER